MPEIGRFTNPTDEQLKNILWLRARFGELQQAQKRLVVIEAIILELQAAIKALSESKLQS